MFDIRPATAFYFPGGYFSHFRTSETGTGCFNASTAFQRHIFLPSICLLFLLALSIAARSTLSGSFLEVVQLGGRPT